MFLLDPYLKLVWENLVFLSLAISFFATAGYAWHWLFPNLLYSLTAELYTIINFGFVIYKYLR